MLGRVRAAPGAHNSLAFQIRAAPALAFVRSQAIVLEVDVGRVR